MLKAVREYLSFAGVQYRNPDKAGDERERCWTCDKRPRSSKVFYRTDQNFQVSHPEWQLQQTSQWMNQAQRLRPHFWVYLQRDGQVTEPMMALRLYGTPADFGISLEVSFIERKKDEQTLDKQAKVLELPVVEGIYYLVYSNGESRKVEATEENRRTLREKLRSQEIRKVLVKSDVSLIENQSVEAILEKLEDAYMRLLPYYEVTRGRQIKCVR